MDSKTCKFMVNNILNIVKNLFFSGKNLFLPAKTIFASPVFTMEKTVFPLAGKNPPTLSERHYRGFDGVLYNNL